MLTDLQQRKLAHLFRLYDADGNGVVELADFERVLAALAAARGWGPGHPRYARLRELYLSQWQALAVGALPPGSGRIPPEGWIALWNAILQASYNERVAALCEVLFESMDADGDGWISLDESRQWFAAYTGDPAEADAVFPRCDLDGDGRVSRGEWLALVDEFFFGSEPDAPGNLIFGRLPTSPKP
jgi:hypothetical protein